MSRSTLSLLFRRTAIGAGVLVVIAGSAAAMQASRQRTPDSDNTLSMVSVEDTARSLMTELGDAVVRLPIATALGAALALRPRRRGTPIRNTAVVETQIVLSIVGAVIMLVVGTSLARAFGIVGVASLIRYRSKIDDPKDAVVMLSALSVGLASGAGHYALATFSTVFLVGVLWIIEGFETQGRVFELTVKLGDKTADYRTKIEAVLRRFEIEYELRSSSDEEVSYIVMAPLELKTARVSNALMELAPDVEGATEWKQKPKAEMKLKTGTTKP